MNRTKIHIAMTVLLSCFSGTAHAEWERSSDCAINISILNLLAGAKKCWIYDDRGQTPAYSEYREFESTDYTAMTMTQLAGPGVVWTQNTHESALALASNWMEQNNVELIRSDPRTLPFNLWVNRSHNWDLQADNVGKSCFAITSFGGSAGDGTTRYKYSFGAIICSKDGTEIQTPTREEFSKAFSVKHSYYRKSFG